MAKVEITSKELLELLNGEIETSELKKKIANEMLRILTAKEMADVVLEMLNSRATVIKRDWEKRVVKEEIIGIIRELEISEILKAVDIRNLEKNLKWYVHEQVEKQLSYEKILNSLSPELEKAFSVIVKKEFDKLANIVKTQTVNKSVGI